MKQLTVSALQTLLLLPRSVYVTITITASAALLHILFFHRPAVQGASHQVLVVVIIYNHIQSMYSINPLSAMCKETMFIPYKAPKHSILSTVK